MPSAQSEYAFPATLTWSHYERLMRVTDKEARNWYMQKAAKQIGDDPLKAFFSNQLSLHLKTYEYLWKNWMIALCTCVLMNYLLQPQLKNSKKHIADHN